MKRLRWGLLGGGMTVVAVVAAFAFTSGHAASGPTSATSFDLPSLGGTGRVELAAYRGKPVVVDLFASWCTACQSELPALGRVARELSGRVTFIAVDSLDDAPDGTAMARRFHLADSGFVLAEDTGANGGAFHDALRAPGMPATAFYDAQGRLVYRAISSMSETFLRSKLRSLYGVG